jgi:hypothetical protein
VRPQFPWYPGVASACISRTESSNLSRSAKTPSRDILFTAFIGGESPQNAAISGELSEPPTPAERPFSSLWAHFLRRNRTTAILVRMSKADNSTGLEGARRGAGLKESRSGEVNRDRTVWFIVSASGRTADLSWGGFDRLVVDLKRPSREPAAAIGRDPVPGSWSRRSEGSLSPPCLSPRT